MNEIQIKDRKDRYYVVICLKRNIKTN